MTTDILSSKEKTDIFRDYIEKEFEPNDLQWQVPYGKVSKEFLVNRLKRQLLWFMGRYKRTQEGVENGYNIQWAETALDEQISRSNKAILCEWGEKKLLANAYGIRRVQQAYLYKWIEKLKPKKVLEVGAGNGFNLFLLASRFPEIEFWGSELTESGYLASKKFQEQSSLPEFIESYSPEPVQSKSSFKEIHFLQANAIDMPFKENEFDLVFTSLALEQMEEVRDQALKEISRISGKHVLMIEPFRDFNSHGLKRNYIASRDYFSARVSDLEKYGLKPVSVASDIPNKIHLGVGVVLAEKLR